MALSRRLVERALTGKLGMDLDQRDHRVYRLRIGGRLVAQTKVSRGTGHDTIGEDLVKAMARDLGVPTPFFRGLVSCTKGFEEYRELIATKGDL